MHADPRSDLTIAAKHAYMTVEEATSVTNATTAEDSVCKSPYDDIFAAYASKIINSNDSESNIDSEDMHHEAKMIDCTGEYALMHSTMGVHIIDLKPLDALIGKTDQPDASEEAIELLSCMVL